VGVFRVKVRVRVRVSVRDRVSVILGVRANSWDSQYADNFS